MKVAFWAVAVTLVAAQSARADVIYNETPRTGSIQFKMGPYNPASAIDSNLEAKPYQSTFGNSAMLLAELSYDHYFWTGLGSAGAGVSVGYAEKYGKALVIGSDTTTGDHVGLLVAPIRATAVYNFDYAALHLRIPLVPYVRGGFAFIPWWSMKGGNVEYVNGKRGAGATWGLTGTAGLAFQLDVLDTRMARDFDNDLGVNHTYLFAEYNLLQANNFGSGGLPLSASNFMFGINFEF